jgi:uncharacterized protein (TIGR03435 family)
MFREIPMIDRLLLKIGLGSLLATGAAFAQAVPPPAFEVVSIKSSAPIDIAALRAGKAHIGTRIDAVRVDIGTASLYRLICAAYRLKPYQLTAPEWLKNSMFDIQAKIPEGGKVDQVPEMLQTLLAERFGLKIHHESKEQPVYALVVAKGGPKMKESAPDTSPAADTAKPGEKVMSMSVPTSQGEVRLTRSAEGAYIEMPGGEIGGKLRATVSQGGGLPPKIHLESSGTTMKNLAEMLSVGVLDRPVVDMTELAGKYEVAVDLSAEDAMNVARASVTFLPPGGGGVGDGRNAAGGTSDPSGASIYSSLKDLGLKLEARKLPLDMLVVDHVEKLPTAN